MKTLKNLLFATIAILLSSCFGEQPQQRVYQYPNNSTREIRYVKTAIDNIITTYIDQNNYSVILADMDYKEASNSYYHKYKIIVEKASTSNTDTTSKENDFEVKTTNWKKVSSSTFRKYQNDLGMTILSKKNGILTKKTAPAGYDNYVGNKKYGKWERSSNGSSFWVFYGQYRFMSDLFYGPRYRYYRNDYDHYRTNYYGSRNYYGRKNNFGTNTYKNKNSSWTSKPKSFKEKIRSKVAKSTPKNSSKSYKQNKSYGKPKQTQRNSNRYSNSSSRSRSGGFGK